MLVLIEIYFTLKNIYHKASILRTRIISNPSMSLCDSDLKQLISIVIIDFYYFPVLLDVECKL